MNKKYTVIDQNPAPPKTYVHAIARWIIRPLVNSPLTPNHVTTLRLISGLAAALLFAMGGTSSTVWGGTVLVISMLLDRADGELARLTGKSSRWGHWYDLVCDMLVNVVLFMGIGYGLSQTTVIGQWAMLMGIVAGLSVGAIFIVVFRFHTGGTHPGIVFNYPDGFDLDDSMFVIPLFAWFDALFPLLLLAAICAPLFLAYSIWCAVGRKVS